MPTSRKWFTCTPIRFPGDDTFFARDSGLLCKGFQEIGVRCKAIMPGPPMDNDNTEDLIRTEFHNLENPDWWKSLGGEGVVFYGWGSGKYVKIVRAIKSAGMTLITHMDTAGVLGVLNGLSEFSGTIWRISQGESGGLLRGVIKFIARVSYGVTIGLIKNDWSRALHLKEADAIGAITPIALERISKVCRFYGGEKLASRVHLIPHPNASYMIPDPEYPKERLVVAVGRWDDEKVKGTDLLMETSLIIVEQDPLTLIEIYGRVTSNMKIWHKSLPGRMRQQIQLKGIVPNAEVRRGLQRARVSLCTSLREGYHTVSAEALCCGCSVVGPNIPEIPSMKWFACGNSGRMAVREPAALAAAVSDEMEAWDHKLRNSDLISHDWRQLLHAPRVAELILSFADGFAVP